MQCPKCGQESASGTIICPGCDFILDAAFLGDDILNEPTGQQKAVNVGSSDAIVLGGLDEPVDLLFSEATGSFLTADTLDVEREVVRAPVYVGKSVQELMKPEAVLSVAHDIDKRKSMLSPFELHVLSFIDGQRPVARLRKKTGLSGDDLRIAVGMLAEKNAVMLVGTIAPPDMKKLLEDELDNTDDSAELPAPEEAWADATAPDMRLKASSSKRSQDTKLPLDPGELAADVEPSKASPSPWDARASAAQVERPPQPPPLPQQRRGIASPPVDPALVARADVKAKAKGFFDLAHSELGKGNRVRAHVYAKLAAETDPEEPVYQELLKTWQVASRTGTSLEASLFADADVSEKQGNHHKALALMQQALDANPNAAHIHNRIGLLLATRFKKYSEASEHLMRACELEANNVVYKNNLGKIIALADSRAGHVTSGKQEKGLLGRLKKALE